MATPDEVVNGWRFEGSSSGVVDGERRFDTPRQAITLSRGWRVAR